jgi:two-component system, NtrC family, sensor kinase
MSSPRRDNQSQDILETKPLYFKRLSREIAFWISRISLRSRLILAFFTLIITSASATVAIGDVVFGGKVISLATAKMEVGLKLTEIALQSQLDRLKILAVYQKDRVVGSSNQGGNCDLSLPADLAIDFGILYRDNKLHLTRFYPLNNPVTSGSTKQSVTIACASAVGRAEQFKGSHLLEYLTSTIARRASLSSAIIVDPKTLAFLTGKESTDEGMLLVAASPVEPNGAYLVATLVNGRTDLLAKPINLVFPNQIESHMASLFLRDRRIATLMGKEVLGTRVDRTVAKTVLEQGRIYLGATTIAGVPSFAAYMPLRDFRGMIIGILGIATPESHYLEMKQQTVSLFAGLIAIGMIFGFIMTYLFSGLLIRPVADLAKGMQRVAEGDLDYKVRVTASDDLGKLSKAFNRMVSNIKERDIRLREMTNEQLSQVDKQVSIGRLAAGVAHEINNPLTSVLSLSMLMLKELKEEDPRREDLTLIVEETTRCRTIVRSLLDFAREVPSQKKIIDINQVIRDTLILAKRYESMEHIEVALKLSREPLLVDGDLEQLRQVFANILINAAEASRDNENGRVVVSTDEDSSGGFVIARVKDRGAGISKENLSKVFQPFFTTKGAHKGTGLGLSVSLGIITKHGGTIEIDSAEGKGTTVTILLPRASGELSEE